MRWEVTCLAGIRQVQLGTEGTALEAAMVGLRAAEAAQPDLARGSWLVLTTHRHDGRVNQYGWRWKGGELVEVRREHWVESPRSRKRR